MMVPADLESMVFRTGLAHHRPEKMRTSGHFPSSRNCIARQGGLQLVWGLPILQHHTGQSSNSIAVSSLQEQCELPSCLALGTHERADEQTESPQQNTTGRKMKATMGQGPQCGCRGRPSNSTPNGQPCADRPPKHIQQELPHSQEAANTPSPLFAAQGVLVPTFHKSESEREVLLFR